MTVTHLVARNSPQTLCTLPSNRRVQTRNINQCSCSPCKGLSGGWGSCHVCVHTAGVNMRVEACKVPIAAPYLLASWPPTGSSVPSQARQSWCTTSRHQNT